MGPGDVGDDCGQEEARIVLCEELRSLAIEKGVKSTLVKREIVVLRKTVVGGVLDQSAKGCVRLTDDGLTKFTMVNSWDETS